MLVRRITVRAPAFFAIALTLLLPTLELTAKQNAIRNDSNQTILVAYASLARLGMLEVIEKCPTDSCRVMRQIDQLMESAEISDVAISLGFAHTVWTFDADATGSGYGSPSRDEGQAFVSRPIAAWNGDLALITSAVSPQRVSIVRLSNVRLGATPTVALVYDSVAKTGSFGADRTPMGTVDRIEIVSPGSMLAVGSRLGSRGAQSKRPLILTFTKSGISFSQE